MAPRSLAATYRRLPPILYIQYQDPVSGYSKALRGLSVLSRVTSIFTGTTISPSPLLRQCPDRYAFRAGRNLPDKEFRYLRTVIVTAAVHWGFGSWLSPLPLTFQHWAGVSPYTSSLELAETCVFAKQSPGPFLCDHPLGWHPFSRSYGVILPSSLTRVLSFALGFSPRPPVSVCGTGVVKLDSSFSCQCEVDGFPTCFRSASQTSIEQWYFTHRSASLLARGRPSPRSIYPAVSLRLSIA